MESFIFWMYMVSVFSGVVTLAISNFIYTIHKKETLKYFILTILALFMIQFSLALRSYEKSIIKPYEAVTWVYEISDYLGVILSLWSGFHLIHLLCVINLSKAKKNFINMVALFFIVMTVLYKLYSFDFLGNYVARPLYFSFIVYFSFSILTNFHKIGNKHLQSSIKKLGITFLLFFPIFILEAYRDKIPYLQNYNIFELFSMPLFFLILNVESLMFSVKFFNVPRFYENNELTKYFIERYSITEREKEIIELLVQGRTYKVIGEELHIAYKTVDNHIQNIYQKLEINSKNQLINLVMSNN